MPIFEKIFSRPLLTALMNLISAVCGVERLPANTPSRSMSTSVLEHEVWVDRPGSIANQAGELMDVARLAGFEYQADFRSCVFAHQVMMDRRDPEQARDRRPLCVHTAVAQDQKLVSVA